MSTAALFQRSNRRYTFTEKFKVFELGLRLDDVRDENLLDFPEEHSDRGSREARTANMRLNGAKPDEVEFLPDHRVELNALTSDRFVDFVERKLTEDGVRKIVPSKTLLQQTYRAIVRGERAKPGIEAAIAEAAESLAVPADLQNQLANYIEENPECPWDVAIAKIARGKE